MIREGRKTKSVAKCKQNTMELLVYEEIERQFLNFPPSMRPYINKIEVATFALNRLPALYVTTEIGKRHQLNVGKTRYRQDIVRAVRQGFAAVQRDPLRKSTPLVSESQVKYEQAQQVLKQIEDLFIKYHWRQDFSLSWDNLVTVMRQVLRKIRVGESERVVTG